jgi:hypothetical protein
VFKNVSILLGQGQTVSGGNYGQSDQSAQFDGIKLLTGTVATAFPDMSTASRPVQNAIAKIVDLRNDGFVLSVGGTVNAMLFDPRGRCVGTLYSGAATAGFTSFSRKLSAYPSGVYIVTAMVDGILLTKQISNRR